MYCVKNISKKWKVKKQKKQKQKISNLFKSVFNESVVHKANEDNSLRVHLKKQIKLQLIKRMKFHIVQVILVP